MIHRFLLWWVGAVALLQLLSGCTIQPAGFPAELSDGFRAFYQSALDQAIWDNLTGEGEGHITHPGLRTAGGVEYYGEVKLIGVDGEVELGAVGHGVGSLTPEARAAILQTLDSDPTIDPVLRDLLLRWLRPE